jgi:hypothetical protein
MKTDSLKQSLEDFKLIKGEAGKAILGLAAAAGRLGMKSDAAELPKIKEELDSDKFKIILVGRFRNGKSTLMNALLGRVTHEVSELSKGKGPMPVGDLPTTATLTCVTYAVKPFVRVFGFDGKTEDWSLERYLREAVIRESEEDTVKFFERIQAFELGYPAERCRDGIMLIDSPGTADVPQRTYVTSEAVKRCDAAIVVYHQRAVAGQDEKDFVAQQVSGTGIARIFTVVNVERAWDDEARARRHIWNRLVAGTDLQKSAGDGDLDFTKHDIYFVNAKQALDGRLGDNPLLVAESGLAKLEETLGNFLTRERPLVHLERFVQRAVNSAGQMQQQILLRKRALTQEQSELEGKWQAVQPQIESLDLRRKAISGVLEFTRRRCKEIVRTTYDESVVRIRDLLPKEIATRNFKANETWGGKLKSVVWHKAMVTEALEWANEIITRENSAWEKGPLADGLRSVFASGNKEIAAELDGMTDTLAMIHGKLGLTDNLKSGDVAVISAGERGLSIAIDLVFNPGNLLAGGRGGMLSTLSGAAAATATLWALPLIGASMLALPVALVVGPIVSFLVAGPGLEKRVKAGVIERADKWLDATAAEARTNQQRSVDEAMDKIEADVLASVDLKISAERENLQEIMRINKQDRSAKAKLAAQNDEESSKIEGERKRLTEILVQAKQIA